MYKYKKFILSVILVLSLYLVHFLCFSDIFYGKNVILLRVEFIFISLLVLAYILKIVNENLEYKRKIDEYNREIIKINKKIERLDRVKSEFISIASHQLRTPLTATKGYTSLILEGTYGKISEEVRGALNKIYFANERLIQLVEDLLNISRIESGKMKYNFKKVNVCDVFSDLYDIFSLSARERNLKLIFEECREDIYIYADILKIREVVSNFIDNAIKYTENGYIKVFVERKDDKVRIVIKDTGIGISKENIPYLFNKFTRNKESAHLYTEGMGLGLYVGKNIVEAHNGRILVKSDGIGLGSIFILELPLYRDDMDKKE